AHRYAGERSLWSLFAAFGLLLGLDARPEALHSLGGLAVGIGKDVRVPPDQFGGDSLNHIGKLEGALLLSHTCVEDDLEQQVTQLVLQPRQITARDCVSNLVGLLKRVGSNCLKILLEVPGTTTPGGAQRRHDLDQAGNV